MARLEELIAEQQKGHENEPRFTIGEQLVERSGLIILSAGTPLEALSAPGSRRSGIAT